MVFFFVDYFVVCLFGCLLVKVIYCFFCIVFRDDIVFFLIKINKMYIIVLYLLNILFGNKNILVLEFFFFVKNFKCILLIC